MMSKGTHIKLLDSYVELLIERGRLPFVEDGDGIWLPHAATRYYSEGNAVEHRRDCGTRNQQITVCDDSETAR